MTHPSRIRAAHDAPDKWARIGLMRDVSLECEAAFGACTFEDLRARGLSSAEIAAHREPVLELISNRLYLFGTVADGRLKGIGLAYRARQIQRRNTEITEGRRPAWAPPMVREMGALEASL